MGLPRDVVCVEADEKLVVCSCGKHPLDLEEG